MSEHNCPGIPDVCPACLRAEIRRLRADRDHWIRLFNRLDAAISHHRKGERFPDDHDEALWAARDRILASAASSEPQQPVRPTGRTYDDPRLGLNPRIAQRVAALLRAGHSYSRAADGWFYIRDQRATPVEMGEAWRLIAQSIASPSEQRASDER